MDKRKLIGWNLVGRGFSLELVHFAFRSDLDGLHNYANIQSWKLGPGYSCKPWTNLSWQDETWAKFFILG